MIRGPNVERLGLEEAMIQRALDTNSMLSGLSLELTRLSRWVSTLLLFVVILVGSFYAIRPGGGIHLSPTETRIWAVIGAIVCVFLVRGMSKAFKGMAEEVDALAYRKLDSIADTFGVYITLSPNLSWEEKRALLRRIADACREDAENIFGLDECSERN